MVGIEVKVANLLGQDKRATEALERAYKTNPAHSFISRALARLYESLGKLPEARGVLEKSLETLPGDKPLNSMYARLLTRHFPEEGTRAEFHWRRSFTEGDANYNSQFWYARQLFINGNQEGAREIFRQLGSAKVPAEAKLEIRGPVRDKSGQLIRETGQVDRLETGYAWLKRDGDVTSVFLHRSDANNAVWGQLSMGTKVSYELGFNYRGPAAQNIAIV